MKGRQRCRKSRRNWPPASGGAITCYPQWDIPELTWGPQTRSMTDDGFKQTLRIMADDGLKVRPGT